MTPSHPRPLPEAPLVEAWGVRLAGRDDVALYPRTYKRHETDVPLVAADRLDEPELPEAVAWGLWGGRIDVGWVDFTDTLEGAAEWDVPGDETVPLYTRAQLTAHAEAVAAVRVREAHVAGHKCEHGIGDCLLDDEEPGDD